MLKQVNTEHPNSAQVPYQSFFQVNVQLYYTLY